MSLLVLLSILLRVLSLVWSLALLKKVRDWRFAFFPVLFFFMVLIQFIDVFASLEWLELPLNYLPRLLELPVFIISVLELGGMIFLSRFVSERSRIESDMAYRERHLKADQLLLQDKAELNSRELQTNVERLKAIFTTVTDNIVTIDNKGIIESCSPSIETLFGYTPEEIIGQNVSILMPEDIARHHDDYLTGFKPGSGKTSLGKLRSLQGKRKDGSIFPLEIVITGMLIEGELKFTGIIRDFTEQRALQRKIIEQKNLLDMLHKSTGSFIETLEISTAVEQLLEGLLELTDSSCGFIGEVFYDTGQKPKLKLHACENVADNPDKDRQSRLSLEDEAEGVAGTLNKLLEAVVESGKTVTGVQNICKQRKDDCSDGDAVLVIPITYGNDVVGVIGLAGRREGYDDAMQEFLKPVEATYGALIHSFRIMEEQENFRLELIAARDTAEKASNAKTLFLSSMSHELRTPLNAIIGFAQLYEYESGIKQELRDNGGEIIKAGKHLLKLINQVLDLSKIESGSVDLDMRPVAIAEVLEDCRNYVQGLADDKGVTLSIDMPMDAGYCVLADYTRLKQAVLNLLENAIKYNRERGEVVISCDYYGDDRLKIQVRDTGSGIPAAARDYVFLPFSRFNAGDAGIDGTGIGLTITRELVELMGGEIDYDSRIGEGSVFWVILPVADAGAASRVPVKDDAESIGPERKPVSDSSPLVLIAEDNRVNRELLDKQMRVLGYRADFAEHGADALQKLAAGQYALLITDINMPVMDGYQLAEQVRQKETQTGQYLPILALTGNAMDQDRINCTAKGMDGFVTKPVMLNELQQAIESCLAQTGL